MQNNYYLNCELSLQKTGDYWWNTEIYILLELGLERLTFYDILVIKIQKSKLEFCKTWQLEILTWIMVRENSWQIDSFSCTRPMVSQLHSQNTTVKLFIRITRYMQKVTPSSLVTNAHYSHKFTKASQHQHHFFILKSYIKILKAITLNQ